MSSEGLFGPVADGQRGGGAPLRHAAVEVEDGDGSVAHALHGIAEAAFSGRRNGTALVLDEATRPIGRVVEDRIMFHRDEPLAQPDALWKARPGMAPLS